ncbi:response regulator transcription factor [Aerophototrophica crusticola]|uniref:Response regulator transcription factor n=1 Tax=Aerophototrophica crusticola TaxID=1709002 RepID=A0A858R3T5_9PROT|nr:response regulator transcription factor [Rhodospirillaceae bacterium B3]
MDGIRIMVVDPCRLFRAGLCRLLALDFRIVAEASDITAALRLLDPGAGAVGLVLLGAAADAMPGEVLAARAALPGARVLHLSDSPTAQVLAALFSAGGDGCLGKNVPLAALAQSMRVVALGGKVFPPEAPGLVGRGPPAAGAPPAGLSAREAEVAGMLPGGACNKAIGKAMGITEATVKVHLKTVMRKINVANRTQAAIWALANGLGPALGPPVPRVAGGVRP